MSSRHTYACIVWAALLTRPLVIISDHDLLVCLYRCHYGYQLTFNMVIVISQAIAASTTNATAVIMIIICMSCWF